MTEEEEYLAYEEYDEELDLEHYGTKRHSGRYPWGSGENPYQHGSADWLARVEIYEKKHPKLSETQVARAMDCTTTQLRAWKALAKSERRAARVKQAKDLAEKGFGATEIARRMKLPNESSARALLNEKSEKKTNAAMATAEFLKEQVKKKGFIDIGSGVERSPEIGVSKEKMQQALELMELDGYNKYNIRIPQVTNPDVSTTVVVLCGKGKTHADAYAARDAGKIESVMDYYSRDGGRTYDPPKPPVSISSKRVQVAWAEDGGTSKDGLIEIRRDCPDLNLGNSHYAQVRIAVDDTHYLKGMAAYSDNLPKGVDIRFNTHYKKGSRPMLGEDNDHSVLKLMKDDPANRFGALIQRGGQSTYIGKDGKEHQSAINKVHDEGDWGDYTKTIPTQFLSKQPTELIRKQINLTYADKLAEYESIKSINNPTIRKHFLESFSRDCDKAAVQLKASSFPRQKYQVILPVDSLKDNEVYAPNYRDGEQLALVRFPHGGTFEIPILTVNNKNSEADKRIGKKSRDAVGINGNVAKVLSGADFDGDDVLAIPCGRGNKIKIVNSKLPELLKDFDPEEEYGYKEGMPVMKESAKGKHMGVITNLITDMTVQGASPEEIARATRHSMVVIDAVKHKYNYKQSEIDNDIKGLKEKYQRHAIIDEKGDVVEKVGGASTLFSRTTGEARIPETYGQEHINQKGKPWYDPTKPEGYLIKKKSGRMIVDRKKVGVNPKTGKGIWEETGKTWLATEKTTQMMATDDARTLSTGTEGEEIYANYANKMKKMANDARKEYVYTGNLKMSPSAKKMYAEEVKSLDKKLDIAIQNRPRERRAQAIATGIINRRLNGLPEEEKTKEKVKKIRQQSLEAARAQVGMNREDREIQITDREWEAIQAGAISENKLKQIIQNTDTAALRRRATPNKDNKITPAQYNKIRAMYDGPYTMAEIADQLGLSTSTISRILKEGV